MWLRRLIVGFLAFATIFSLFYVAKLLRISGEPSKQASGKKTITDFQVENHYVIYDGKSWVYHPIQFDFRILDSKYRGANSWQFTAAFLVWDESDPNTHGFPADPLKANGELKDATRLVRVTYSNNLQITYTYDEVGNRNQRVSTVVADIALDGFVDFSDFAVLASRWLDEDCIEPSWCEHADLDRSNQVDNFDLVNLANNWLCSI